MIAPTRTSETCMPDTNHSHRLQRHFVTIPGKFGTRQVHYRRGGQGPVVLLLHQSPQSSREMEAVIGAFGDRFTLIAPDAPGYGFSQALRHLGEPLRFATIEDFAAATLEFADALGLGRFGVYGFHTGASIGVALAERYPERIAAVAANGLVIPTPDELAAILREYLPAFVPHWDGSHLAWLWARMREQTIFFPWHDRRLATRMTFDMPPADRLQAGLLEFLAAGEHYHVAYGAAFGGHAERRLPAVRVPLLVTASAHDPLAGHLARIANPSATVHIEPARDAADALERSFAHLRRHPGDAPTTRLVEAPRASVTSEYHGNPGRQVRVVRTACQGTAAESTVILLHPAGSSAAAQQALASALAPHAEVLAADLPGHGASDPASPAAGDADDGALARSAERLATALVPGQTAMAGGQLTLLGVGSGAPVALELARQLEARHAIEAAVVLLEPPAWSAADVEAWLQLGLPSLEPVWSGGHLLEAWHMVRDSRLFTPWFRRERAGIRRDEPDLDNQRIQREVSNLLRANGAWQAVLRDALAYREMPGDSHGLRVTRLDKAPGSWSRLLTTAAGSGPPAS